MTPPSPPKHDAELLARARSGDVEAFGALFEAASERLLLYIRTRLSGKLAGRLEPADVLQETGLAAFRDLAKFENRGRGALSRWLCAIAENRMRDLAGYHAAGKREPRGSEEALTAVLARAVRSATGPLTAAARDERHGRLVTLLEGLEEDERQALILRYFAGAKPAAIATELGRSESAVRRTLARAAARIGDALGKDEL